MFNLDPPVKHNIFGTKYLTLLSLGREQEEEPVQGHLAVQLHPGHPLRLPGGARLRLHQCKLY